MVGGLGGGGGGGGGCCRIAKEKNKRKLFSLHEKKKIPQEIDETSQENIESAHRYLRDSDIKSRA